MDWTEFWAPIQLSLKVSLVSSLCVTLIGVGITWFMTRKPFRGKLILETVMMLPLVLPPTVVGFLLLVMLGRKSRIGSFLEWLFSQPIVFSWWAAVIASVVVAVPLVYQTMKVGFEAVDEAVEDAARSDGANEWQVLCWITLPLAFRSIVAAYILGFARGLGEFGATLMIAGNIPHKTQTIPTAIYVAVDAGRMQMAWAWTGSVIVISFLLLLLTGWKPGRH